jgi:hypothetical protein
MKAMFLKDEQENLWLFHATDIKIRRCVAKVEGHLRAEERACFSVETRDMVLKELDRFQAS